MTLEDLKKTTAAGNWDRPHPAAHLYRALDELRTAKGAGNWDEAGKLEDVVTNLVNNKNLLAMKNMSIENLIQDLADRGWKVSEIKAAKKSKVPEGWADLDTWTVEDGTKFWLVGNAKTGAARLYTKYADDADTGYSEMYTVVNPVGEDVYPVEDFEDEEQFTADVENMLEVAYLMDAVKEKHTEQPAAKPAKKASKKGTPKGTTVNGPKVYALTEDGTVEEYKPETATEAPAEESKPESNPKGRQSKKAAEKAAEAPVAGDLAPVSGCESWECLESGLAKVAEAGVTLMNTRTGKQAVKFEKTFITTVRYTAEGAAKYTNVRFDKVSDRFGFVDTDGEPAEKYNAELDRLDCWYYGAFAETLENAFAAGCRMIEKKTGAEVTADQFTRVPDCVTVTHDDDTTTVVVIDKFTRWYGLTK